MVESKTLNSCLKHMAERICAVFFLLILILILKSAFCLLVLSLWNHFLIFSSLYWIFGNLGAIRVADLLVKSKASLNIENNNGDTPLKLAKVSGSFDFNVLKSKDV